MSIRRGEIYGLAGVDGNGQKELLESIICKKHVDSGQILINGKEIQTIMSKGERINLPVERNTIYLVKTSEKTFKVIL